MGVRGFTTFITKQANLFYETHQLKNCYVVIDGNGVSISLYSLYTYSNDCCGGDYDQYAKNVYKFFSHLKECNVTPIILFDGCLDNRKMDTILDRMRSRICALENLAEAFPLFTTKLFEGIALSLGVKCIRTEHESDSEIACLGKYLDCPILGNDSDFYFFDTLYIPFNTFKMKSVCCDWRSTPYERYIPCEVYKIKKFLNHFEGLDKTSLPLLPVLLGNDYVDRSLFSALYGPIKEDNSRFEKKPIISIETVIKWLQHETLESAISKILGCFNADSRKSILIKLKSAMKGYLQINSTVTEYLVDMGIPIRKAVKNDIDILGVEPNFEDDNDSGLSYCERFEASSESDISEFSEIGDKEEDIYFNRKYRTCLFPACFGVIKWKNRYFCFSQVENHEDPDSHRISFDILVAIHKILNPSSETPLKCFFRIADTTLGCETLTRHDKDLPDLVQIQKLQKSDCKLLLLEILKIDKTYEEFLNMFPPDWHLFLISLYYWKSKSEKVIDSTYIYSLIICAIVLNFVDTKIGFLCRSQRAFEQTLKDRIPWKSTACNPSKTIQGSFDDITYDEGLLCLKTILSFFYTWPKNNFDESLDLTSIVGYFSEFQSCSLHIKYLNAILDLPFENLLFSKFFSGTFLYNTVVDFRKRSNLKSCSKTARVFCSVLN